MQKKKRKEKESPVSPQLDQRDLTWWIGCGRAGLWRGTESGTNLKKWFPPLKLRNSTQSGTHLTAWSW